MKITIIKINYGRTINRGNFESERIDVEFSATVEDNESAQDIVFELQRMAKDEVRKIANQKIKRELSAEDFF